MSSREIFKEQLEFNDGTRIFAVVHNVTDDTRYPADKKFRFQYYDPGLERDNKTIVRYDNCHEREGHKSHKHVFVSGKEIIEPLDFEGNSVVVRSISSGGSGIP